MASKSNSRQLSLKSILATLLKKHISDAAPAGPYGRLKNSIRSRPSGPTTVEIFSLYYWARFVNDGRRPIKNKLMIWYKDPTDDPRTKAGYARKQGQLRKLTKKEIKQDRDLLIRTIEVAGRAPTHFIEHGIQAARPEVSKAALKFVATDVRRMLKRSQNKISVRL